jgi:hypothetical protein
MGFYIAPASQFFEEPILAIWNSVAVAVWSVAIVALFLPRSKHLRRGWASKALWILALCLVPSINYFWIPYGPIVVLIELCRGWADQSRSMSGPASARPAH